jgi:hypothetical protein
LYLTPLTWRCLSRLILDRNHYPKNTKVLDLLAPIDGHVVCKSRIRLLGLGWSNEDKHILHHLAMTYRGLDDGADAEEVDREFSKFLMTLGNKAEARIRH